MDLQRSSTTCVEFNANDPTATGKAWVYLPAGTTDVVPRNVIVEQVVVGEVACP
jgi:hypothetical protein